MNLDTPNGHIITCLVLIGFSAVMLLRPETAKYADALFWFALGVLGRSMVAAPKQEPIKS